MKFERNILITGGAGFIGSHVVRLFVNKYPNYHIVNLDKLTYAGNLENLRDIEDTPNYTFVKADICDFDKMQELMAQYRIDGIIHLAAESHVDRSIKDPFTFARTNVMGTLSLLQAAKLYWETLPERYEGKRFYHISTDEVYGALRLTHPEGIEPPFITTASSLEHHLAYGKDFFMRILSIILIALIQLVKRVVIILYVLIMIHMECLLLSLIVVITMVPTSFPKN